MAAFPILLLLLAAIAPSALGVCDRIFIRGLDTNEFPYTQSHEGVYRLDTDSQHPRYVHETMPMEIQLSEGLMVFRPLDDDITQPIRLTVSIKPGFNVLSWMELLRTSHRNEHQHPFRKIIGSWIFADDTTGENRELEADVQIQCAEERMHRCSENALRFNQGIRYRLNGKLQWAVETDEEFVQVTGEYNEQRPVYYAELSGNVLFYLGDHWVIAREMDANPIARVQDSSYLPEYIAGFWEIIEVSLGHVEWKVRRHLHLVCEKSIEDALGSEFAWCSANLNPCENAGRCYRRETHHGDRSFCLCQKGYSGTICEDAIQTCPAPHNMNGSDEPAAFSGIHGLGDIAVIRCNEDQFLTSVCAHDSNGQARWQPDDRVKCNFNLTNIPELPSRELRPLPEVLSHFDTVELSVNESLSTSDNTTTSSDTYSNATDMPEITLTLNHTSGNETNIDRNMDPLDKFMMINFSTFAVFFIIWVYPVYVVYQFYQARKNEARECGLAREHHIQVLATLYEMRDEKERALREQHPNLVFSREHGVFIKDTSGYTESQKEMIAGDYHRIHRDSTAAVITEEKEHKERLRKIVGKKQRCLSILVTYCNILIFLCAMAYLITNMIVYVPGYVNCALFMNLGAAYVIVVYEAITSKEAKLVFSAKKSLNTYLDELRREQPLLIMEVEVSRTDVMVSVDMNGSNGGGARTTTEHKTLTHEYSGFEYAGWRDDSGVLELKGPESQRVSEPELEPALGQQYKPALFRVNLNLAVDITDEALYHSESRKLQEKYEQKGVTVKFTPHARIRGMTRDERIGTVAAWAEDAPCLVRSRALFVLSAIVLNAFHVRRYIRRHTTLADFTVRKTLYCSAANVPRTEPGTGAVVPYDQGAGGQATMEIIQEFQKQRQQRSKGKPIYRSNEQLC